MRSLISQSDETHAVKYELAADVLRSSGSLRMQATGWSMLPTVWPGDTLVVEAAGVGDVFEGDIVLFTSGRRFVAHRVVKKMGLAAGTGVQTRGDAVSELDSPVPNENLLGRISLILKDGKGIEPERNLRFPQRIASFLFQRSEIAARVIVGIHGLRSQVRSS